MHRSCARSGTGRKWPFCAVCALEGNWGAIVVTDPLVTLENVSKVYRVGGKFLQRSRDLHALSGVSLSIAKGEALGLVGESGSGKSTLGNVLLGLTEASSGSVRFEGIELTESGARNRPGLRKRMQLVFQDPFSSLNPTQSVGGMLREILAFHKLATTRAEREAGVQNLLHQVGMPADAARRYPHEFSGGQRQRIVIARALATNPDFIVADEPVSALDVSIQAQIVQLIKNIRRERGLTMLLIAHDLGLVQYMSDRVGVLYLGHLVEIAPTRKLFAVPRHPYTETLLSVVPTLDGRAPERRIIPRGEIPSPMNLPSGCVFRTRCRYATEECAEEVPALRQIDDERYSACIRPEVVGGQH